MSASPDPSPADELALARAELALGQSETAAQRLVQLLDRSPGDVLARYWLAAALGACGAWAEHTEVLRQAQTNHALNLIAQASGDLQRMQADPAYALQVGDIFYGRKQVGVASVAYGMAAMAPAAPAAVLLKYGLALQHQGRIQEANAAFTAACEKAPGNGQARGFLLYSLFFSPDGVACHAEAARGFAKLYDHVAKRTPASFDNPPLEGRRLRIGYVAPDAMGTQLRQFLGPVLETHDPETVEIFHYVAAPPAPGRSAAPWRPRDGSAP